MEESEVRNHLVVGEGPYLTLAEDQYCVSGESRFLPVNLPISLCKSVHIALLFFLSICLHPIFIFSLLRVSTGKHRHTDHTV